MALRREYKGNAAKTTLSADITASSTTIGIVSGTNWPTGATGNFFIIIDRGLSSEEKVLCSARSGNTLTVASSGRGADDTSATAHLSGANVEHGMTKTDADEANDHVADTTNDDHTQYLNNARHDVEARHAFGAALGAPGTPSDLSAAAASAGSGDDAAREDHVHGGNVIFPEGVGVWTSYTPTLTQSGAVTKTVTYARFQRVGRLVVVQVQLAITGSGTAANPVVVGLPVTASTGSGVMPVGSFFLIDASVSPFNWVALAFLASSTTIQGIANQRSGYIGATGGGFEVGLASGDTVSIEVVYEAAS